MLSMQSFLWLTCQFEKKVQHFDSFQGYDPLHDLDGKYMIGQEDYGPQMSLYGLDHSCFLHTMVCFFEVQHNPQIVLVP